MNEPEIRALPAWKRLSRDGEGSRLTVARRITQPSERRVALAEVSMAPFGSNDAIRRLPSRVERNATCLRDFDSTLVL